MTSTLLEEEAAEHRVLSRFEKGEEFLGHLRTVLDADIFSNDRPSEEENEALRKIHRIMDEYQEQSYLLDPWLERIVVPPVENFREYAFTKVSEGSQTIIPTDRVKRLSYIIYYILKTRGQKVIVPFFPHQVSDLKIAISFVKLLENTISGAWNPRYVSLLWLSLICRIPFDLSSFDDEGATSGQTAQELEDIAHASLDKSGLERDAAALLLAHLYTREDTHYKLASYLTRCEPVLAEGIEPFKALGALQVIANVLRLGSVRQLEPHLLQILELAQKTPNNPSLATNVVIRRYALKVSCRVALSLIPPVKAGARKKAKTLDKTNAFSEDSYDVDKVETEFSVSGDVEGIINDLLNALQDRDTDIRGASAKYIARVGARVPDDFVDQLVDAILAIYEIHYVEDDELPATAEPSWHGASLACAEFARQGLISASKVESVLSWNLKALFFDVRKGAHSVGSNVRDSACYVFWALARTQDFNALKPHATTLAQALMTAALLDREVHIRRAASAAFQENVGRMGLLPHGIDVLKLSDFYSVGVRRNAFLIAAPQVSRYPVYRPSLLNNLIEKTLRHWDATMRQLGSQSLREICQPELAQLAPGIIQRLQPYITSSEMLDMHGAVLGLRELAEGFRKIPNTETELLGIFEKVDLLPEKTLAGYRNDLLLEASCQLIASSSSDSALQARPDSPGKPMPKWKMILDLSLKHRNAVVQEAGAQLFGTLSQLRNNESDINKFIAELKTTNPAVQQGMTRVLGYAGSQKYPQGILKSINCLLGVVKLDTSKGASASSYCVEARRNSYESLTRILKTLAPVLSTELEDSVFRSILRSFLDGLDDYTVDERGDVGSWVRIACIKGLSESVQLVSQANLSSPDNWVPRELYQDIWAAILKQGAERLDNVRAEVGRQIVDMLAAIDVKNPQVTNNGNWIPEGVDLMRSLFVVKVEVGDGWNEAVWIFPRIVQLLRISRYRLSILRGMVISIGSKTETTQKPAASALIEHLTSNETYKPEDHITETVTTDLLNLIKANPSSNAHILPILATFDLLIEGGLASELAESEGGIKLLESLIEFTSKNVDRMKNVQRITSCMRILVQLMAIPQVAAKARASLPSFLGHAFPKIREETAEFLYLAIQTQDLEGGSEAEAFILETDWAQDGYQPQLENVIKALNA